MSADQILVEVTSVVDVSPSIREFTLSPVNAEFYPFSPGSHVVVEMPAAKKTIKNAYSLLSDPLDTAVYKIAVRLQEQSRGGSVYMHQQVTPGDQLKISPPANLFAPQWQAKKHILIAGGVGITPFMSYLPELERRLADYELHYLYRSDFTGAYRKELAEQLGERFFDYDSSQSQRCDLAQIMSDRTVGTHFYICGPEVLIDSVKAQAEAFGIPASVIHYEEFAAPAPGEPFEVELKKTGQVVSVSSDESMLEALEAANVDIPNLCRGGVCGQCVCQVADGDIEHRDNFLSESEKQAGTAVMPCVSRAKSDRLVLDI
ncbi:PDR/VanB family oxidoreductase [Reinekea thalattae]|uniref:Oxidoreductase n=1 Tax=Reinekea thalattae TaxID=2593301 RepID=A0A5C8Z8H7_9GAMM|nr:PDR/VanB family oxidoreductase [Reinekea thalattae]TXR53156.1 oxidoreductase [Reinekea thalattae]